MSCAGGIMQVNASWRISSMSPSHLGLLTLSALKILPFAVRLACWRCRVHRVHLPRVFHLTSLLPPLSPTAQAAFRTKQLKVQVVPLRRHHLHPRQALCLLPRLFTMVAGPPGCRHPLLWTRLQPSPSNNLSSLIPIS